MSRLQVTHLPPGIDTREKGTTAFSLLQGQEEDDVDEQEEDDDEEEEEHDDEEDENEY